MLKNYFKTAWRNLTKNKAFSAINILGLTIGITVCLMIFLFIMNEFSVDNFHKQGKNIYRVMRGFNKDGQEKLVSYLSGPYAPALLTDFKGEIKEVVRVLPNDALVKIGTRSFHEKKVYDVDSTFFTFFSFPLLRGNPATMLNNPSSVVLTETIAKKYFGSVDNAMDKVIEVDQRLTLKVTGVAKDVPTNSHLYFDLIVPLSNYNNAGVMKGWINNGLFMYALLDPKTTTEQKVESRMPQFMDKYMGATMKKYGFQFTLSLMPLKDVYFEAVSFDDAKHGDKAVVYIFLSIAALILLIGCINFMNLSTIRAAERSKEVGLRKVLGALRNNLMWQFIGESVLITAISCVLSVVLLVAIMPLYNQLLGYTLLVNWNASPVWLFLAGMVLVVGFLAGSYPALVLSAFSPVQALKGRLRLGKGGSTFRQVLVVVQFSISVFLIIGTIFISKQMSFVKNKKLGYNTTQTVKINIDNNDFYRNMKLFKTGLQQDRNVQEVSMMSGEPGGFFDVHMFEVEDHPGLWQSRTEFTDFEYAKLLDLKIIAGRDLSSQYPTDSAEAVLINRKAAASLGWSPEQSIGKWVKNTVRDSTRRRIVGVVEDFNFLSLKENLESLVICASTDKRVALVKLRPGSAQSGIASIQNWYNKVAPAYPLEYSFLDTQFDEMYKNDLRQQTILNIFTGLAIFIACLGLFGLSSFTATKRFKEIGVRKVLGSSVQNIVVLLSKDLLKPVLIAACIALPAGYYAMNTWLENFAYKTTLSWWVFVLAAFITFGIAFLTVSIKALKAAMASPVKSIRTE